MPVPLPVYTSTLNANLEEGYDYFRSVLGEFLGYGTLEADWTTKQLAELNRRVQEAYRHVLYPEPMGQDKVGHIWSFMEVTTTLITNSTTTTVLETGTSDSGTTTTMVDAARTETATNHWNGKTIKFTSGSISGQSREIIAFNPDTDTITFTPALASAVSTETYQLIDTETSYDYDLPSDFGSIQGNLTYPEGTGYGPVKKTSEQLLRTQRQFRTRTGHPEMYAVRWKPQVAGQTQRQEILLYPTPDGTYTLTYKYSVYAPPLSKTNPFPIGGPLVTQLMIEACKAVGEAAKYGAKTDQWDTFQRELYSAVQQDKRRNEQPTVGVMRGTQSRSLRGPIISGVDYYYGPGGVDGNGVDITDGQWSLES